MNLEQELQTLENLTQFSFEKELGQLLAGAPSSPSNSVSGGEYPQPKEKGGSTKGGFNFDLHQSETRDEVYIRKYGVQAYSQMHQKNDENQLSQHPSIKQEENQENNSNEDSTTNEETTHNPHENTHHPHQNQAVEVVEEKIDEKSLTPQITVQELPIFEENYQNKEQQIQEQIHEQFKEQESVFEENLNLKEEIPAANEIFLENDLKYEDSIKDEQKEICQDSEFIATPQLSASNSILNANQVGESQNNSTSFDSSAEYIPYQNSPKQKKKSGKKVAKTAKMAPKTEEIGELMLEEGDEKLMKKREVTLNYKNKRTSEETKNLPTTIGKILLKCLKKKITWVPQLQKLRIISNKEHFQQLFNMHPDVQKLALQFLTSGPMMAYLASSTRLKQKRLVVKYLDIIVEGAIDPQNFKCFKQNFAY